jgi:hypothetical protein
LAPSGAVGLADSIASFGPVALAKSPVRFHPVFFCRVSTDTIDDPGFPGKLPIGHGLGASPAETRN